ncbi:MAG: acyl-CoA dehydrogenase family protein [Chloroflexi bacterium]|nr:acyl-CoA dehydrogenase family protein [Chloroflexota bacterium]
MIDFAQPQDVIDLRARTAAFIRDEVIPEERFVDEHDGLPPARLAALRDRARAAGLFAPHAAAAWGGLGLDMRGMCAVFEAAGQSLLGPLALNCAAPDEGNMHLLAVVASPAQQERFLRPLVAGAIRSCFAMTEPPPGAGSDPAMLRTRAERDGDGWVITGDKWYVTGADGAAFAIVMADTGPRPDGRPGATMLLVDAGTPGYRITRHIPSLDGWVLGGHCALSFRDCRVGPERVLGEVGNGFRLAQVRLGPARLTHCMRWLGIAQRSLDIALAYASRRESFGQPLGAHQMVGAMLADSAMDLHAARLMVLHAAWLIDGGGQARHESSMAKTFVAEAVNRVVDRAVQICGSHGVSNDLPLAAFYRAIRPFRIYDGPSEVHRLAIARRLLRAAATDPAAPTSGAAGPA